MAKKRDQDPKGMIDEKDQATVDRLTNAAIARRRKMPNKVPLDEWIDDSGLRDFVYDEMSCHLIVYGIKPEDIEELTRLIMISLRQALNKARERGLTCY